MVRRALLGVVVGVAALAPAAEAATTSRPTALTPSAVLAQGLSLGSQALGHAADFDATTYPGAFGLYFGRSNESFDFPCPGETVGAAADSAQAQSVDVSESTIRLETGCPAQGAPASGSWRVLSSTPQTLPVRAFRQRMLSVITVLGHRIAAAAGVPAGDIGSLRTVGVDTVGRSTDLSAQAVAFFNPPAAPAAGTHGVRRVFIRQRPGQAPVAEIEPF